MNLEAGVGKRIQSSGVYNFSSAEAAVLSFSTSGAGDVAIGDGVLVAGFVNNKEAGSSWGAELLSTTAQSGASYAEELAVFISGNNYVQAQAVGNQVWIYYTDGAISGSVESVTLTGGLVARIVKAEMGRASDPAIIEVEGTYLPSGAVVPDAVTGASGVTVELPMCWVQSDAAATLMYVRKGD
jgi:hypothetical protein